MKVAAVVAFAAVAALAACRPRPAPARDAAAPPDVAARPTLREPTPRRVDAGAPRDAAAVRLDGGATTERAGALPEGVVRLVRAREGMCLVWCAASAEGTDVMAQRLDAEGDALGAPRVLRTVPGRVEAFDADARDGLLWVAWSAHKGTLGRWNLRRTAVLVASDDLTAVRGPATLEDLQVWPIQRRWRALFAEVRAGDGGSAALLLPTDNTSCPWGPPVMGRLNWVDCPGWRWWRVSAQPRAVDDHRFGMVKPDVPPSGLTRVPGGWLYARGPADGLSEARVVFDPVTAGRGARVLGAFTETVAFCARPRVAWTGGAYVLACEPVASTGEPEGTRWVRVVRADGTAATTARTTATRLEGEGLRCVDGRPQVELRWDGGMVRLDPAHPGASLRVEQWNAGGDFDGVAAAVWSGTTLTGVTAEGARLVRWRCNAAGEVVRDG